MSGVRPLVTEMEFLCCKCGAAALCRFPDGKYAPPASCSTDGCRSRTFAPDRPSATSTDFQKIRVQVDICSMEAYRTGIYAQNAHL